MMYNKAELTAMQMIAGKLNWHKPVDETIEIINQMVRNTQALDLDCVGECDDFEETLLSIALWDAEKIFSTMIVSDYQTLADYNQNFKGLLFLEDRGLGSYADITAMIYFWDNVYDPNDFHVERRYQEELLQEEYYAELQAEYEETLCSLRYGA